MPSFFADIRNMNGTEINKFKRPIYLEKKEKNTLELRPGQRQSLPSLFYWSHRKHVKLANNHNRNSWQQA